MMRDAYTEKRALEYIRIYGPPNHPREDYANRMQFIASFIPTGSVLDVACGAGHLSPCLKNGSSYNGVDSSPHMIKLAKQFFPAGRFSVGDAFDLSNYGRFDTVVANSLFIHIEPEKHQTLLQNLWNHAIDQLMFTIPIMNDVTTLTNTEGQEAKTLITNISFITLDKLITSLNPAPKYTKHIQFQHGSFGYGAGDYLIILTR